MSQYVNHTCSRHPYTVIPLNNMMIQECLRLEKGPIVDSMENPSYK